MSPSPIPAVPLTAERSPWLRGTIRLPGDPFVSVLALILAAMARGESVIEGLSGGREAATVIAVLRQLGAHFAERAHRWHAQGIGTGGFLTPNGPLDLTGAGDAAQLLVGLLGAHDFDSSFIGLTAAPMGEALLDFVRRNGGKVERTGEIVTVRAPRFGIPLDLALSAEAHGLIAPLLLQALVTTGTSTLHLPEGVRDPAEGLLALFGAKLSAVTADQVTRLTLEGMSPLRAQALTVPGDPRLAAYPAVAALIAPDSEITINSVALHPGGLGLLDALALLGGDIAIGEARRGAADVTVRHAPLVGTTIPADLGVGADDYPILAIAAAFAEGETLLEGLTEGVRRLGLTRALRANGIDCVEQSGGLVVRGAARVPGAGNITTRLDPKLAMAFLVLGMAADRPVTIDDGAAMQGLFPDFTDAFEHIGASFAAGSAAA
ncbi:MAG: hypothetical protein ABI398_11990 [Devosia sp.]